MCEKDLLFVKIVSYCFLNTVAFTLDILEPHFISKNHSFIVESWCRKSPLRYATSCCPKESGQGWDESGEFLRLYSSIWASMNKKYFETDKKI